MVFRSKDWSTFGNHSSGFMAENLVQKVLDGNSEVSKGEDHWVFDDKVSDPPVG